MKIARTIAVTAVLASASLVYAQQPAQPQLNIGTANRTLTVSAMTR